MSAQVMDIFPGEDNPAIDKRLRALEKAAKFWKLSYYGNRRERLDYARELYEEKMFSLNQLAKICRLSVPTVARALTKNSPGGRFSPESLSSLTYIRKVVIAGEKIPMNLVRTIVEGGTSISEIARLTGAPETQMYVHHRATTQHLRSTP
jgi:hypothetical protein